MFKTFKQVAIAGCCALITLPAIGQENPKLSDAEVASVAVTANQIDISAAKLAQKKSKNPEITKFAETMINDHQAVIDQASALVKKLGVAPKDNDVSRKLLADAKKTEEALMAKSGPEFDTAYIENEVAYHKAVISAINGLLIPETENQELKELLQNVLPAFNAHLEHAEMVKKQIAAK